MKVTLLYSIAERIAKLRLLINRATCSKKHQVSVYYDDYNNGITIGHVFKELQDRFSEKTNIELEELILDPNNINIGRRWLFYLNAWYSELTRLEKENK